MRGKVGHQLRFIANANHLFGGFYKPFYFARNFRFAVYKRYGIAFFNTVFFGVSVRNPHSVRAFRVVFVAACKNERRYVKIRRNRKRDAVTRRVFHVYVDG